MTPTPPSVPSTPLASSASSPTASGVGIAATDAAVADGLAVGDVVVPGAEVPGYPQRRVLDVNAPIVPPPVAGSENLPVPSTVSDADQARTDRELAEDRRAEHRLVLYEILALLTAVAIVIIRQLWLS